MGAGPIWVGVVIFPLIVFVLIGGPMVLADWLRNRRQQAITRQIALTDAIDGELGAIVAPVVKKPLWGPWQIRIAVPFARTAAVGKILGVAHEVLSVADRMNPGRYEIVLTPTQDPMREERKARAGRPAERWPGGRILAAWSERGASQCRVAELQPTSSSQGARGGSRGGRGAMYDTPESGSLPV